MAKDQQRSTILIKRYPSSGDAGRGPIIYRLAKDIGVPALRISQIVRGQRAITADTALRLARYFGTSAAVWLRLQARYDLEVAEAQIGERISREVKALSRPTVSLEGPVKV